LGVYARRIEVAPSATLIGSRKKRAKVLKKTSGIRWRTRSSTINRRHERDTFLDHLDNVGLGKMMGDTDRNSDIGLGQRIDNRIAGTIRTTASGQGRRSNPIHLHPQFAADLIEQKHLGRILYPARLKRRVPSFADGLRSPGCSQPALCARQIRIRFRYNLRRKRRILEELDDIFAIHQVSILNRLARWIEKQ